jgi:hypothetical protein
MRGLAGGRTTAVTGVVAMLAVLLSGCGGSDVASAGRTLPPLSSEAAPMPSSDSPPPAGHLTRHQELMAAEATVRRYFAALNELPRDMEADKLAALLTAGCGCQKQVVSTRYYARRGGRFVQHGHIVSIGGTTQSPSTVAVLVRFSATAGGVKMPNGKVVNSTPAIPDATEIFTVVRSGSTWLIDSIETPR